MKQQIDRRVIVGIKEILLVVICILLLLSKDQIPQISSQVK